LAVIDIVGHLLPFFCISILFEIRFNAEIQFSHLHLLQVIAKYKI